MKTVFMGSDQIALPMLQSWMDSSTETGVELCGVFTQPDRPSGRGMKLHANPVKKWAVLNGLEVRQPPKCTEADAAWLKARGVELLVVMAYGQLLPQCILEAPEMESLNLHASLLPRLRGASPIHTAVANGYRETGVSLMRMVRKMDAGPVADVERISIQPDEVTRDVQGKIAIACVPLMQRALPRLANGSLSFYEQDPEKVSYCRIIDKSDAHLDFSCPAQDLANRIRAFQPWPGTSFPYEKTELKIRAAQVEAAPDHGLAPGTLLCSNGSVKVACGEDVLKILKIQRPGSQILSPGEFLRGFPMKHGTSLESRPMRDLEAGNPFPYRKKLKS